MKTRQEMVQDRETFLDRARGVMSGLAIGDSFGDASRKPDNQLAYGITTDFGEGASWSTDDTEFGLLTAQTLIEANGRLTPEIVAEAWKKHVVTQGEELNRGGNSEMEAAANLRRGLMPPYTGLYNAYAFSDGAAMRAAPIGIVFAGDLPGAAQAAEIDASISHCRDGVWGAQSVACAVAAAVAGASFEEILDAALYPVPKTSWYYYTFQLAMDIVRQADGRLLDAWMPLHDRLATRYKASVPEAVSQAFGVLALSHEDFRTGVITAGNFGRDADTIAAICGAVLGGMYGYKAIPARWAEKTRYPSGTCLPMARGIDLLEIAGKLCALAQ
ncbi:MAG TPA: ADP-ribosylglycohydrolase family protein [Candidatus Limiplasma pullistercoris]|nr:ADP-ribosylglycohydrolase family protein [Candidatus Limiplasma pullistercoris]